MLLLLLRRLRLAELRMLERPGLETSGKSVCVLESIMSEGGLSVLFRTLDDLSMLLRRLDRGCFGGGGKLVVWLSVLVRQLLR